jgi:hypothetical protein
MRFATAAFISASLLIAAAPATASDRASDNGYLRAARCQGLAHAAELGSVDTTAIDAYVKAQATGRNNTLLRQAKAANQEARAEAAAAGKRARLTAERDRMCKAWIQTTQVASSGASGTAGASN